jgi:hypothetical protein
MPTNITSHTTGTTINDSQPNSEWVAVSFPDSLLVALTCDTRYRRNKELSLEAIGERINLPRELVVFLVRQTTNLKVSDFISNPTPQKLIALLKRGGYAYPEALFDQVQTFCPVTSTPLDELFELNWAVGNRFAYSPDHQIIENGIAVNTNDTPVVRCRDVYINMVRANDIYISADTTAFDGRRWPTDWLESNTGWCANCEQRRWSDDLYYDEDSDQHICDDESNCTSRRSSRYSLLSYNDSTANHLPSDSPRGRRMGLEIEWLYGPSFITPQGLVEYRSGRSIRYSVEEAAHEIVNSFPEYYCILKRDGSLRVDGLDVGLEFVTRPERLPVHREILTRAWGSLPIDPCDQHTGLMSQYRYNGCEIPIGLHIHAERWGRSLLHQAKVYYFMSLATNRAWIVDIAQRVDERYARFPTRATWQYIHGTFFNGRSDCSHNPGKYVALRILPATMEFRIFRSHTQLDGVLRCLEFVEALFDFTKLASARELQATRFVKFIADNRKAYPCLFNYVSPQLLPKNRTK